MYFITGVTELSNEMVASTRCFGYFSKLEDAEFALENNVCDMWETIYHYMVVEKIEEGIHSISEEIDWYKYNENEDKFERITYREETFCNYALG